MKRNILLASMIWSLSLLGFGQENQDAQQDDIEERAFNRDYHFGIGIGKFSSIGNDYNHYEKLFGEPAIYPEFWVERSILPLPFGLDLSLGFRIGMYQDKGKSAEGVGFDGQLNADLDDSEVTSGQKSRLTLIPIQLISTISYTPFDRRWVIINFFAGLSQTYIENTLEPASSEGSDGSSVKPFVNSGWNQEVVTGASLSFDISAIDTSSSYSLRVYGIERMFLTPFLQIVTTAKDTVGTFDREMYGIMFTFETWQ
ncbi:MAG: hypothetical protein HRU19_21350 [Pseudobacteriovorax sp.]|nr:hypothetical protein [Pseudobacteriovorax sp.]